MSALDENATPVAISGDELAERIRQLAAQGLRVRDISSLLHVHPQIVIRVIEEHAQAQ
jgi:hypothetical protein